MFSIKEDKMANIDYSQTIPDGVPSMIAFGIVALLTVLVIIAVLIIRKWHGRVFPVFAGLISYVVFVFLLSYIVTALILTIPGAAQFFADNGIAYSIMICVINVLAFMIARIVLCKVFIGRYDNKGDICVAGVGLAAGDCISYVITMISYSLWCNIIQSEGLQKALETTDSNNIESTYKAVSILFEGQTIIWPVMALSYILDVVVGVVFMCLVYAVVTKQLKPYWYAVIAAANIIVNVSFQNYDVTSIDSILIALGIKLIVCAVIVCYMMKVKDKEIVYSND